MLTRDTTISNGTALTDVYLRIGDVAQLTGLTQRTIRYYEELGLLPPPTRTQGDFRLFSTTDVERLQEIVRLKGLLGVSLSEIKQIIEAEETRSQLRTEYRATEDHATRLDKLRAARAVAEGQLDLLNRKMLQLEEMRGELEGRLARYARLEQELTEKIAQGVEE
jgi:MerR family transcriptional regulator, repressor of the yfmOP operon